MEIQIRTLQRKIKLDRKKIEEMVEKILLENNLFGAEISVLLVNDRQIRHLNRTFRGVDRFTNVLTFPMQRGKIPLTGNFLLGDIVVSVESAQREAQEIQCSLEDRIGQLLVHGFLHLRGFDHSLKEDEKIMRKKEKQLWNKIQQDKEN